MNVNAKPGGSVVGAVIVAVFVAALVLCTTRPGWTADQGPRAIPDSPLLVVVETGAGAGCDALHVRRAVQEELGVAVIAPTTLPPQGAVALLVRVDREKILLTFRGQGTVQVSRMITTPPGMSERLRAIAWLAGNLVRDQLSPLVVPRAVSAGDSPVPLVPLPSASVSTPVALATPMTAADTATGPATEPPPLAVTSPVRPLPSNGLLVEKALMADARTSSSSPWSVTIGGGPIAAYDRHSPEGPRVGLAAAWQLEVLHHRATGSMYGLALDIGPEPGRLGGIAGVAGAGWRLGSWLAEVTAAAGLEAQRAVFNRAVTSVTELNAFGSEIRPVLYARGMVALGRPLTRSVDLFFRLGAHLASHDLIDDFYVTTSFGLRLKLP